MESSEEEWASFYSSAWVPVAPPSDAEFCSAPCSAVIYLTSSFCSRMTIITGGKVGHDTRLLSTDFAPGYSVHVLNTGHSILHDTICDLLTHPSSGERFYSCITMVLNLQPKCIDLNIRGCILHS
jgi:hypothetical protein